MNKEIDTWPDAKRSLNNNISRQSRTLQLFQASTQKYAGALFKILVTLK